MGDRSISIGRDNIGGTNVTGDHSVVETRASTLQLPAAESVDIKATVAAIQAALGDLQSEHRKRIDNALDEAADEAAKAEPDKDEIGQALERAVGYATQANGFVDQVGRLAPHLKAACGWLGQNWHKLLAIAGVTI